MAPTTTDSTNPLLLTQKDQPLQFQFTCQKANFVKIQDYIDPDKVENKIKENTKPEISSIATALVAPTAPAAAPITPAAAPTALTAAPIALAATLVSTKTATPALSN